MCELTAALQSAARCMTSGDGGAKHLWSSECVSTEEGDGQRLEVGEGCKAGSDAEVARGLLEAGIC